MEWMEPGGCESAWKTRRDRHEWRSRGANAEIAALQWLRFAVGTRASVSVIIVQLGRGESTRPEATQRGEKGGGA